ncbi:histidine phosphatase family protein [Thermithiobacillus plumbiphilus]|uniref:Histidine phosphatase family protein n=1 Tax=Thermithiobacillus plumbiphilus TaxID=1729899 RepID=A0ABU9DA85_9PROT
MSQADNAPTGLDFLRHGEPVGGSQRYRGQIDDPLSEHGWAQMRQAVAGGRPWTRIVSSPLMRCRAFAEELAVAMGLELEFDERLKEVGFGVWEGRTRAEISAATPGALERFRADPLQQRPEGAEPLGEFLARVGRACTDLVTRHAGEQVLVVCHAGVMRAVFHHALQVPLAAIYDIQVRNAEFSRFRHENGRYTLLGHGLKALPVDRGR